MRKHNSKRAGKGRSKREAIRVTEMNKTIREETGHGTFLRKYSR